MTKFTCTRLALLLPFSLPLCTVETTIDSEYAVDVEDIEEVIDGLDESPIDDDTDDKEIFDDFDEDFDIPDSPWDKTFQSGYFLGYGYHENGVTRNMPYFLAGTTYQPDWGCGDALHAFEGLFRGWYDFAVNDKDLEIRTLFYHCSSENWSLKVGFQQIAWGEAFGLFIADIVDPRDLTDPFFNELSWVRLPNFTFNLKYFSESWSIQIVFTPIPRNNQVPNENDPYDVLTDPFTSVSLRGFHKFHVNRWGKDAEYGISIGRLFESGLDLSLFYFRHRNRNPIYKLKVEPERFILDPVVSRINTVGLSFSKAFEEIVVRGDSVIHIEQPWWPKTFGIVKRRNVWRTIVGFDKMADDGTTWGVQYHVDHWREDTLHWLSAQYIKDFCDHKYLFEAFFFKGINNQDLWLQLILTRYFENDWQISLRTDILNGKKDKAIPKFGLIGPFRRKDRLLLWLLKNY